MNHRNASVRLPARVRSLRCVCWGSLLLTLSPGCVAETELTPGSGDASTDDGGVAGATAAIRDATPVPAGMLLPLVQVFTWRGMCSGTLIATDRVLTAAHCVCTEDLVGSNHCQLDVSVHFRPNPITGEQPDDVPGSATPHPSYNPSWVGQELENDLAVVALASPAPSYVTPMDVATQKPSTGSDVMVAGYGLTGSGCSGPAGTLNFDIVRFDRVVDDGRILQWDDPVTCSGDSGGAITNLAGTVLYAVHSSDSPTLGHGSAGKAIATSPYYSWIRGLTCSANLWDRCDDKATMCRCSAGVGDCDVDADCRTGLRCAQNVGASFGQDPTLDMCVPASGPVQGTCSCGELNLRCVAGSTNRCSVGYTPRCNPVRETATTECGGCTCQ